MTDNEVNTLKTDIALIQRDVKQIEIVFQKVDNAVSQMSDIHKSLAVQENILEHNEKRLDTLEEKLIKHTEESTEFQKELNINFNISASSPFTIFKKLIENCEKKIICKYINIGSVLNEKVSPDQSVGYHIAKMSAFSIFKIFSVYYRSSLFSATSIKIGYLSSREKLKGKNKTKAVLYDISDDCTYNSRKNYTLNHLIERIKTYNEENFNYEIITIQLKKA